MKGAYYNEIDPYAAAWLRNLITAGHIAPGDVDERDIRLVQADDIRGYRQCHFFAGIGVWSYALRLAGWPDDRPAWTGSCPCQPYSIAGGKGRDADERHLWPQWFRLIRERRPIEIFGEQVASPDGLAWLDLVHSDLEAEKYAVGAIDLPACGFGAPHIRQRLWFVADAKRGGRDQQQGDSGIEALTPQERRGEPDDGGIVGDASGQGLSIRQRPKNGRRTIRGERTPPAQAGIVGGFWTDAQLVYCADERWRPIEPGTFPLAHGINNRVGRLRATGNAITAPVAAEFIGAYMSLDDIPRRD